MLGELLGPDPGEVCGSRVDESLQRDLLESPLLRQGLCTDLWEGLRAAEHQAQRAERCGADAARSYDLAAVVEVYVSAVLHEGGLGRPSRQRGPMLQHPH